MKFFIYSIVIASFVFSTGVIASDRDKEKHRDRDRLEREHRHQSDRDDRRQHRRDLAESQRYNERKYRRDQAHRNYRRDSDRHRYDHKYDRRNRHHRHYRDRHGEYFLGGLVLGSLGTHYWNDHHYRHNSHFDNYYWRDRYGDCFRVEYRKRGKVYVQVPRRKCRVY